MCDFPFFFVLIPNVMYYCTALSKVLTGLALYMCSLKVNFIVVYYVTCLQREKSMVGQPRCSLLLLLLLAVAVKADFSSVYNSEPWSEWSEWSGCSCSDLEQKYRLGCLQNPETEVCRRLENRLLDEMCTPRELLAGKRRVFLFVCLFVCCCCCFGLVFFLNGSGLGMS